MYTKEFAYWLQGWYENNEAIGLDLATLNSDQLERVGKVIRSHLALAFEVDTTPSRFTVWLDGYLDSAEGELALRHFLRIKNRLAEEFVHVIDPSYEGDPEKLNAIHSGQKPVVALAQTVTGIKLPEPSAAQKAHLAKMLAASKVTPEQLAATLICATFKRPVGDHPLSFQYVNGVKMGKDGETPDRNVHFDSNSEEYVPGARC